MNKGINGWMNEWIDGWMNELMDGWINKWIGSLYAWVNKLIHNYTYYSRCINTTNL